jgi:hypothetical protein
MAPRPPTPPTKHPAAIGFALVVGAGVGAAVHYASTAAPSSTTVVQDPDRVGPAGSADADYRQLARSGLRRVGHRHPNLPRPTGFFYGAVRSGKRAADEVHRALSG